MPWNGIMNISGLVPDAGAHAIEATILKAGTDQSLGANAGLRLCSKFASKSRVGVSNPVKCCDCDWHDNYGTPRYDVVAKCAAIRVA